MASSSSETSTGHPLPYLRKTEGSSQLIVKGQPFLMLAGELQNSTLSDPAYMAHIWPSMKAMNINTLLGPVAWDMIEPTEGNFTFNRLEKCILGAREHGLHLVLLWFGAYKNARSTYAPAWVKKDVKRFPRIHTREGGATKLKTTEVIQPYGKEIREADSRAFARLMRYLREFDAKSSTVIMVQVQNEMGLLYDSRDRSKIADQLYQQPVPAGLLKHLQMEYSNLHPTFHQKFPKINNLSIQQPTWEQAFGKSTFSEDLFMADAFSRFAGSIAAAGRAEYDIPLYMNAALCSEEPDWQDFIGDIPGFTPEGSQPGQYPSGGPIGHNLDVYLYNAPDIQFYAPDIYLQNYETICKCFRYQNLPLFVPEQRRDEYGARRVWLAYGTYQALGCAPFGIDTLPTDNSPITKHFKILHNLRKYILDAQANRSQDMMGFFFDEPEETQEEPKWEKVFGDFKVKIDRAFTFGRRGSAAGLVMRLPNGNFLCAGFGYEVLFESTNSQSTFTGILDCKEMEANEDGTLRVSRILGGDETQHGTRITMPSEKPDFAGFPIPFIIPARTMMVECSAYSLEETEDDF